MKKTLLLSVLLFSVLSGHSQVTSLNENFNSSCISWGTFYPTGWSEYNNIPPVSALAWHCVPAGGRASTPGMECTSFISGVNYMDTAWLFTPQLLLSGYPGKIFLRFDSRFEFIAARLSVLVSNNYIKNTNPDSLGTWTDLSSSMIPAIDPTDSADWITRSIDLSGYKTAPIYVAFRFISSTSLGGTWTIDNINTTTAELNVGELSARKTELTILGMSTTDKISFACTVNKAGIYDAVIYDNIGREVYREKKYINNGTENITLENIHLHPGMYLLKVGNQNTYGVVKTIVE